MTRAADMDAQAALQHVVMTYSPVEGRRIYVNGVYTGDADAQGGGQLADWDDTFALVLGNETSTNRQWEGVLRMVAIHNRALTPTQIQQNFDAGVGEKYFMLFNVSHLVTVPQAYVMLEASQLDSYGLQFAKPTFISLDPNASVANLPIAGIRIGVNGSVLHAGQAYVPLEPDDRWRWLHGRRRPADDPDSARSSALEKRRARRPVLPVLRHASAPTAIRFRIRRCPRRRRRRTCRPSRTSACAPSMSSTPRCRRSRACRRPTRPCVSTYTLVKQALPAIEKLGTFGPAQQTGLAQLAIQYCSQMVETPALRTAFFGGSLNPAATAASTFGSRGLAERRQPRRGHRRAHDQGQEHRSRVGSGLSTG